MKKFLKRAITAILVATMLLGATMAVGCDDDEDKNTTVIRIMSHGGGYGRVWLDEVCNEFSAMVAEKEYTPGKKGVKFKIESNLETNIALMSTSGYNIYFAGSSLQTKALANKGDIMEIDDIVTTPYTDVNGETYTIESLIEPGFRENLKVNGKYYALPHFSDFPGIAYDAENFAKGGFYFADTTDEATSKEVLTKAIHKLPIRCKIVKREKLNRIENSMNSIRNTFQLQDSNIEDVASSTSEIYNNLNNEVVSLNEIVQDKDNQIATLNEINQANQARLNELENKLKEKTNKFKENENKTLNHNIYVIHLFYH